MHRWILKSIVQRAISLLPCSRQLNALMQKHVTHGYYASEATFEGKLATSRQHLENYRTFSKHSCRDISVFELGTGTWPIVPIALFLCGAREVHTYDIESLIEPDLLENTLSLFATAIRTGRLEAMLPDAQQERMEPLENLIQHNHDAPDRFLAHLGIHLHVGDARATTLPAGSIDLVFSTVVFEHVPRVILLGLMAEFRRILRPGGVMSHFIGLEDQYCSFDRGITPYNFLRYSSRQWRWLNNPIIPLTRLRVPDYREVTLASGFQIVDERHQNGSADDLRTVPLAPEFRHHPFEDLLPLYSWMVSTPHLEASA